MRVIAGKARRLQLKTVEGLNTRPTTDRVKETLFNMIHYDVPHSKFLDLFSGSGAIGIEALSRGADTVYFVENNRNALRCIKENLRFTKLEDNAIVLENSVEEAIKGLKQKDICFDFVFMDPPYNHFYEKAVLQELRDSRLICSDTQVIVEASLETDFSYAGDWGFEIIQEKKYKTNKHVFLKISGD